MIQIFKIVMVGLLPCYLQQIILFLHLNGSMILKYKIIMGILQLCYQLLMELFLHNSGSTKLKFKMNQDLVFHLIFHIKLLIHYIFRKIKDFMIYFMKEEEKLLLCIQLLTVLFLQDSGIMIRILKVTINKLFIKY